MKPNAALSDAKNYAVRRMRETGEHQRVVELRYGEYLVQDFTKDIPPGSKMPWTTYRLSFRESLDA